MLLFILLNQSQCCRMIYFNTSHVTVYPRQHLLRIPTSHISIHLMLLFILSHRLLDLLQNLISIHLMLLFIEASDYFYGLRSVFQYISCYCLSEESDYDEWDEEEFQYISCYCLSTLQVHIICYPLHFNTSHVTVYLLNLQGTVVQHGYFNTSHVTVYRFNKEGIMRLCKFQYISCYCLSL